MTKLFLAPNTLGYPELHLVGSFFGRADTGSTLFTTQIPKNYKYTNFTFVATIEEADYILVPHAIKVLNQEITQYLDSVKAFGQHHGKKVLLFIGGDMSHDVFVDGVIVFKGSQYRYMMRDNEIIVPPFVEDLLEGRSLTLRPKSQKPSVSFCGWADFSSVKQKIKYVIKNISVFMQEYVLRDAHARVHKKGIYFRRKAMSVFNTYSDRIITSFIVRRSFSASSKTISLDPVDARKEYIENIAQSDFVLAPKGDANFSVRFYEILSLGRIPILIDTETPLPLEKYINYDEFILRISYEDIEQLPKKILALYANLNEDQFKAMQQKARDAFRTYLRYDAFFSFVFGGPVERLLATS